MSINKKDETDLIYQDAKGIYLKSSLQPYKRTNLKNNFHKSTRYTNVVLGKNDIATLTTARGIRVECKKELPQLYGSLDECCGCSACYCICPNTISKDKSCETMNIKGSVYSQIEKEYSITGAISMLPDECGFLYPVVDASKCIRCYKCIDICPLKNKAKND